MGEKLIKARLEETESIEETLELEQTEWMNCAQTIPKTKIQNQINQLVNKNFDWETVKANYTLEELVRKPNWIIKQKEIDQTEELDVLEDVDINKLNKYQKFTYNIVKLFKESKKQLFAILLG
jgi:hypothetical protein